MSDGTLIQNAADAMDNVVRGETCGLVDYEYAIHGDLVIL
jgi:hypothetical protein